MFVMVIRPGGSWMNMGPSPDTFCLTLATSNVGPASCAATIPTAATTQTAIVSFLIARADVVQTLRSAIGRPQGLHYITFQRERTSIRISRLDRVDDDDARRTLARFELQSCLPLERLEHRHIRRP